MPKPPLPRIAILGAGPIGLEAALYARQLKLPFTIYERGQPGEHLRRWGHVRLFTPLGQNVTPLGRKALGELPPDDTLQTGREHVETYLAPLSELCADQLRTETQVLRVGRRGCLKTDRGPERAKQPFQLLLRQKTAERLEEADVVLDCTGTYAQHRWLGSGGIPAVGELLAEPRIAYGLEDVLGEKRNDYANRSVLVVGGGYSAATTVSNLATLAEEQQSTWIIWLARGPGSQPLRRNPTDPLRERDRLAQRANTLATRTDGNVEYHGSSLVEALEPLGQNAGFRVTARVAGTLRTWEVERVIGNVGYTPDTVLYRELQVQECPVTLGPLRYADVLAAGKTPGPDALRQPDPGFYILGAKSHGRGAHFMLRHGFAQVRDAFALILSDSSLDLYRQAA